MTTYAIEANPGLSKSILYGMWLQLILGQNGYTDAYLQPSPSDSPCRALAKILAVYQRSLLSVNLPTITPGHSESILLAEIIQLLSADSGGGGGTGGTILATGQAQLIAGAVTVSNSAITATSKVDLAITNPSNSGWIVATVAAGQVTFASSNSSDTSKINYNIFA